MNNKEFYIQNPPKNLPLFHAPFWLDCVCPDEWDVALVIRDNKIVASMPYHIKKENGRHEINMPELVMFLGPHIANPTQNKKSTKVKFEIECLEEMLPQIPEFSYFRQTWHFNYQNWLPFYWQGYKQTTRYTYLIDKLNSSETVWNDFKGSVRTDIKKAEKEIKIESRNDSKQLYELINKTYKRQQMPVKSAGFYEKLIQETLARNCGKVYVTLDSKMNLHAAIFIAWDDNTVYYVTGGHDERFNTSGAMTLLLWHAIQEALSLNRNFDFAGSIAKNIEIFFRNFGGDQKMLFQVSKKNMNRGDYLKESIKNFKKFVLYKPGDESKPSLFH